MHLSTRVKTCRKRCEFNFVTKIKSEDVFEAHGNLYPRTSIVSTSYIHRASRYIIEIYEHRSTQMHTAGIYYVRKPVMYLCTRVKTCWNRCKFKLITKTKNEDVFEARHNLYHTSVSSASHNNRASRYIIEIYAHRRTPMHRRHLLCT